MVMPTGSRPVTTRTRSNGDGYQVWYQRQQRFWQKAPFTLPLPYSFQEGNANPGTATALGSPWSTPENVMWTWFEQNVYDDLVAQSYEKFKDAVYSSAALGVDFAERRQSIDMMASSLTTLLKFTNQVRKLDFVGAAATLRMKFVPKGVDKRKSMGSNWLEYHFGWEPLIHDIYDAMEVINNPLNDFNSHKGKAFSNRAGQGTFDLGSVLKYVSWTCQYRVMQGGTVRRIDNSVAHTLDQFGLINPAVILWELIPFSFVIDWFANVGNVLASYSDFAGLSLTDTWSSVLIRAYEQGVVYRDPSLPAPIPGENTESRTYSASGLNAGRSLGLSKPSFSVKPLRLPSLTRAVTASALLSLALGK
jgi:hypothetical protein